MNEAIELIETFPKHQEHSGLWSGNVITIVGTITMTQRGIFKSHMGDGSNRSSVDVQTVNGATRAELRGIKIITKMRDNLLFDFRDAIEGLDVEEESQIFYAMRCKKNDFCGNCPNCKLFGSLRPGKFARRSRLMLPDLFSIDDAEECVAGYLDPDEEGVLNQVDAGLSSRGGVSSSSRGSSSFATYEYVRPGTKFPFKIIIRDPSQYDVWAAIKSLNDVAQIDGVGTYSSRNGRFSVKIHGIADASPLNRASNLSMASNPDILDNLDELFGDDGTIVSLDEDQSEQLIEKSYDRYFDLIDKTNWAEVVNRPED